MSNKNTKSSNAPTNSHAPLTDAQKAAQAGQQQQAAATQPDDNTVATGPGAATVQKETAPAGEMTARERELLAALADKDAQLQARDTQIQELTVRLEKGETLTRDGVIQRTGGDSSAVVSNTDRNASQAPNVDAPAAPGVPVHQLHKHKGGSEQVIEVSNRSAEAVETDTK